jgi:hypothetical protein
MKNLHLIPTDKPSRLCKSKITQKLSMTDVLSFYGDGTYNQHIYITSDEEIKEDDWFTENGINTLLQWRINKWKMSYSFPSEMNDICKKIILTTDQDLIKDGVQAIDDIFLEWFVENPSCESVEVDKNWNYPLDKSWEYKLRIIPQEEPKQETLDFISKELDIERKRVHKQETLEEAAKRTYQKGLKDDLSLSFHDGVKFGAEWQAERMYSDMEEYSAFVLKSYKEGLPLLLAKEWFEQFKKNGGDK